MYVCKSTSAYFIYVKGVRFKCAVTLAPLPFNYYFHNLNLCFYYNSSQILTVNEPLKMKLNIIITHLSGLMRVTCYELDSPSTISSTL